MAPQGQQPQADTLPLTRAVEAALAGSCATVRCMTLEQAVEKMRGPVNTPAAAEAMIALIPGEAKQVKFFDSGHMLPHTYIEEVIGWLNTAGW